MTVTASKGDIDLVTAPVLFADMVTGGQVKQIPYWTGQPVADKILPIDVIGHIEVNDGDDVDAIDAAAAAEVAAIITAASLSDLFLMDISIRLPQMKIISLHLRSHGLKYSFVPVTFDTDNDSWSMTVLELLVGT